MNWKCKNEEKNSKTKWAVLLLLLILLVLVIVIVILLLLKMKCGGTIEPPTDSSGNLSGGVGLVIDPTAENGMSYDKDDAAEQGVAISGQKFMTIPADKKEIEVDFYNPEENAELYFLTFELRLYNNSQQGYEVLYTSGLVEPGKHINQITLSRKLEEGVYEAAIHVQPYRMNEERTLTNNADIKIDLIVK